MPQDEPASLDDISHPPHHPKDGNLRTGSSRLCPDPAKPLASGVSLVAGSLRIRVELAKTL
jgi:hypothetical protein